MATGEVTFTSASYVGAIIDVNRPKPSKNFANVHMEDAQKYARGVKLYNLPGPRKQC